MKRRLMDLLQCPNCGNPDLELIVEEETADGEIIEGQIVCRKDCKSYPIFDGIPRMVAMKRDLDDTKHKFEHQWRTWGKEDVIFGRTRDESRDYLLKYAGFDIDADFFKGKRVLDAGCGHGRFVELFSDFGAELSVGIDIGEGIQAAQYRNAGRPNVELVQGNLLSIPFREGLFDYVWCNGVIHHTPDPKGGLQNLCKITNDDGYVNVWVYPLASLAYEYMQGFIRFFTTRMPPKMLMWFCYMAVPLLYVLPTFSGTNPHKNSWRHCAQVIYDWYSPRYQSHHSTEEVAGWFNEYGFTEMDVLDLKITIVARRP